MNGRLDLKGNNFMMKSTCLAGSALLVAAMAFLGTAGSIAPGYAHDAHGAHPVQRTFSAGEPGNPKQSSRVVEIKMRESDGKMLFTPDRIEVRRNEQVRLVLKNDGAIEHEFMLATVKENAEHGEMMMKAPDMRHDDPNGKRLESKGENEILWRFTKCGEFEFACLIPGHYQAGMFGKVVVK
jgi:uncharacterized cupredoxin-like copper-binding protein